MISRQDFYRRECALAARAENSHAIEQKVFSNGLQAIFFLKKTFFQWSQLNFSNMFR